MSVELVMKEVMHIFGGVDLSHTNPSLGIHGNGACYGSVVTAYTFYLRGDFWQPDSRSRSQPSLDPFGMAGNGSSENLANIMHTPLGVLSLVFGLALIYFV